MTRLIKHIVNSLCDANSYTSNITDEILSMH